MTNYEQLENISKYKVDFESRTLFVSGEITDESAEVFLSSLFLLSKSDGDVRIFINSVGGDWDFGAAAMIAATISSDHHITTEVHGAACSGAALLFAAGDTRIMHSSAYLMLHDGSLGGLEVTVKELKKTSDLLADQCAATHKFLEDRSSRPEAYWRENLVEDYYIFAEKAKELGLATNIA